MTNSPQSSVLLVLLDVDNTLLDNDQFGADLGAQLEAWFGAAERDRYWSIFAALRAQSGYADYLGALQQFRAGLENLPALLQMSAYLLEYPFAERLYPRALQAIAHLHTLGRPVILSDGEVVFQPRKIQRSGLWDAVRGEVLIYLHKQRALAAMTQRYPATQYVCVDDKLELLMAMKQSLGDKLRTIWVRQGKYAAAAASKHPDPSADCTIEAIGDLCQFDFTAFLHV